MGSHSGLCRHKSPKEKKDHLLIPKARAAENDTGWGGARESEQDVLSCARLLWAYQGRGGSILGRRSPTWCHVQQAWPGSFPASPALPSSHAARDLPATALGQVCPKKVHRTQSGPMGVWRNGRPNGGKRWSAKSRNQNYTKGKKGRVHEAKTAREVFAFNAHRGLPSLPQEEFCHPEPSSQ